jgi:hypothetical protein
VEASAYYGRKASELTDLQWILIFVLKGVPGFTEEDKKDDWEIIGGNE